MTQITVDERTWKRLSKDSESTLHNVLLKTVPASRHLSSDAIVDIKIAMLGYMMHVNSFNDLKKVVRYWDLEVQDAYKLYHGMLDDFETNLAIKQAILICLQKQRENERINYSKLLKRSEMNPANELLLANLSGINFKGNLLRKVKEPLLLPPVVRRNCGVLITNLEPWITRFVYRKLHFVVKHNEYEHDDPISDMKRKGVEAYYHVTPLQVEAHRENSVKQAIHNQVMKEISFYTSAKRARLSNNDHVPKQQSIYNARDQVDDTKYGDNDWQVPTLNFESDRVMQQYIDAHRKQAHIVLKLLYKDNDIAFEKFVRSKMKASDDYSIEQIGSSKPRNYVKFIADYHDIPELTVRRIAYELLRAFNGEQTVSNSTEKGLQ